jgi:hypothetical protein
MLAIFLFFDLFVRRHTLLGNLVRVLGVLHQQQRLGKRSTRRATRFTFGITGAVTHPHQKSNRLTALMKKLFRVIHIQILVLP